MKRSIKGKRGNYKVKLDGQLKNYPVTTEIGEFYLSSLLEEPIRISRWVWNWKFPFLHNLVTYETFMSLQKKINKQLNRAIDAQLFK